MTIVKQIISGGAAESQILMLRDAKCKDIQPKRITWKLMMEICKFYNRLDAHAANKWVIEQKNVKATRIIDKGIMQWRKKKDWSPL